MLKIGLLGLGTVGSGVYEMIQDQREVFQALTGEPVVISKVLVKDIHKERKVAVPREILTTDPYDILNDPTIPIVIEVMGGIPEAYSYMLCALNNGKHVVTANKAVVAEYMDDLLSLAELKNKAFLFEASVGGGIPIIKPLKQHARINEIREIKGILNGTSNFILSKMTEDKIGFQDALQLAQELGYAEADPTDDVQGYDAARKLAILSSIAFKGAAKPENISCRGINTIGSHDIEMFDKMGFTVKLLGKALLSENQLSASTEPVLVKEKSMFATVKDAYNMISVHGSTVGQLSFYGQGAGKNPTAHAVICDVMDILTGAYRSDPILQEKSLQTPEEKSFPGQYYGRVTPKSGTSETHILDFLKKENLIDHLLKEKEHVVFIANNIHPQQIEKAIHAFREDIESFLYVRMEDPCLFNY